VDLEDVWGPDGSVLRERLLGTSTPEEKLTLLETVLLDHLTRSSPDDAIRLAARGLAEGSSVSEVADRLGLLPRRLSRRFQEAVGLRPKRYARIRRLQRLLRSMNASGDVDWAELAVAHGYYDQAHFINEFREATGLTPTAYRPRSRSEHNHVPLSSAGESLFSNTP
jgi:transcriptional regulator GlxA family with amidase domain